MKKLILLMLLLMVCGVVASAQECNDVIVPCDGDPSCIGCHYAGQTCYYAGSSGGVVVMNPLCVNCGQGCPPLMIGKSTPLTKDILAAKLQQFEEVKARQVAWVKQVQRDEGLTLFGQLMKAVRPAGATVAGVQLPRLHPAVSPAQVRGMMAVLHPEDQKWNIPAGCSLQIAARRAKGLK